MSTWFHSLSVVVSQRKTSQEACFAEGVPDWLFPGAHYLDGASSECVVWLSSLRSIGEDIMHFLKLTRAIKKHISEDDPIGMCRDRWLPKEGVFLTLKPSWLITLRNTDPQQLANGFSSHFFGDLFGCLTAIVGGLARFQGDTSPPKRFCRGLKPSPKKGAYIPPKREPIPFGDQPIG